MKRLSELLLEIPPEMVALVFVGGAAVVGVWLVAELLAKRP